MTDVIESKAETVESVDGFDPSGDVLTAFTFPGVESGAKALIVTLIGGVLADAIGKIHNASASAYRAARANAQWWLLHDTRDAAAVGSAAWCFNELDLDRDVIARAVEKRWADSGALLPFHDRKWGPYWQWEAAPLRAPLPLAPEEPIALRVAVGGARRKRDRLIAEAAERRARRFSWESVVRVDYLGWSRLPEPLDAEAEAEAEARRVRRLARQQRWYVKNRERLLPQMRARYYRDREGSAARVAAWAKDNPEALREQRQRYYARHREERIAYNRARYRAKRAEILAQTKAYAQAHAAEKKAYYQRWYRANVERIKARGN